VNLNLVKLGVVLALCPRSVFCDVLHESLPTASGGAMLSDFHPANFGSRAQRADDFIIDSDSFITSFDWWGQYAFFDTPTAPDNFTVRIFSDVGETPSLRPVFELPIGDIGRVFSGFQSYGSDVYQYSFRIEPFSVRAGRYWLSVVNDTASDSDDGWYWQRTSLSAGLVSERELDSSNWETYGPSTLAFRVDGFAVPEPSPQTIIILGSILIGLRVRRNERKTFSVAVFPRQA
jgi:hypothetical protein